MVLAFDSSRMAAAFAAALALHALALMLLVRGGPVRLSLVPPPPVVIDLVTASDRTAGPGEHSEELRIAAASPPPAAALPAREEPTAPAAASDEIPPAVEPVLPPKPAPRTPPARVSHSTPKPAAKTPPPETSPSGPAAGEQLANVGGGNAAGASASSAAPAWAPTARVAYESVLYAWINRHKMYPLLAQRRGLEGSAAIRVRIDRDGRVLERSLDRSSGAALLDEAALDIVRRASPFPRVPAEYAGSSYEFVAPIEYRLHMR